MTILTTAVTVATACARSAYIMAKYARAKGLLTADVRAFAMDAAAAAFEDWAQTTDLSEESFDEMVTLMDDLIKTNLG